MAVRRQASDERALKPSTALSRRSRCLAIVVLPGFLKTRCLRFRRETKDVAFVCPLILARSVCEPSAKKSKKSRTFQHQWYDDKPEWKKWVKECLSNSEKFLCIICNENLTCGRIEIDRHSKTKKHLENLRLYNFNNSEVIRSKIQLENKANIENHWDKICKKVNHRDHTKFFSIINKVFRPQERSHMPNLSIKEEDSHLIDRCDIKKEDLNKTNNEYIIEEEADKINIIGAFYETINFPKYLNANTRNKEIADRTVQELEQKLAKDTDKNKTITEFSQENRAYAPNNNDELFLHCIETRRF
ncbi:hypothetical protein KQX54_014913 [Cotesia glomerata]|uniref:U1-type domain-containing protein n=1 Tax=Cotesia glomerata TaxID=32391 RepID=A0AAV7IHE7_COTGL|nr:hypothetical protein KQX54_014913 [Cotesia glomerata]